MNKLIKKATVPFLSNLGRFRDWIKWKLLEHEELVISSLKHTKFQKPLVFFTFPYFDISITLKNSKTETVPKKTYNFRADFLLKQITMANVRLKKVEQPDNISNSNFQNHHFQESRSIITWLDYRSRNKRARSKLLCAYITKKMLFQRRRRCTRRLFFTSNEHTELLNLDWTIPNLVDISPHRARVSKLPSLMNTKKDLLEIFREGIFGAPSIVFMRISRRWKFCLKIIYFLQNSYWDWC